MKSGENRIPVIVGIGELIDRSCDPALEPVEMMRRCALAADEDAGGGFARRIDVMRVVNSISWPYRDLPGLLARKLRLRSCEGVHGQVGGETPVRLLMELAADVASGYSEVALLCGAEATRTAMQEAKQGRKPQWSDPDPHARRFTPEDFVTPLCARYGLVKPIDIYPLYENAARAAWNLSFEEMQAESGEIWSRMSQVAAHNPCAWSGKPMTPAEITTPSDGNRMVAFPYTKFQVAQIGVNQAAALLLTHRDAALAAGVPEERLIYVWAGAGAQEPRDILARSAYDDSPVLQRVLLRTLEINGLAVSDVDLFELYSCFPIVPKLARRALGLPADAQLSVSGGLTFFGGPVNNFMTHAAAAMVRALRSGQGRIGLLHGNGEFVTKHQAAILATTPPPPGVAVRGFDLQPECDADRAPVPELDAAYAGPATIETFTVAFTPQGAPDAGAVILRTPDGRRTLARVTEAEPDAMALLLDTERQPIGGKGFVYDGGDGLNHFALSEPVGLPEPVVLFERLEQHVALVTLNRPEAGNTVNGAVTRLMAQYVERIDDDPDIRVAILAPAGEDAFCAGADLAEVAAGHAADLSTVDNGFAGFVHAKRRKPWIAAVRGAALSGGMELALACDLAIAGKSAAFGLPEVAFGFIAAAGGSYRLPRTIPPRVAMELILSGETIDAARALELHLINRVVPDAAVLEEAQKLAARIAANAPAAVEAARALAASAFDGADAELARASTESMIRLMATRFRK
jgi:acetyl-CoA C-acetyltransferase